MVVGMGTLTLKVPVVSPTDCVVAVAILVPPAPQSAQLATTTFSACAGTQFAPVTVMLLPAAALVEARLKVGALWLSTVKGLSSDELMITFVELSNEQMLLRSGEPEAEMLGQGKVALK